MIVSKDSLALTLIVWFLEARLDVRALKIGCKCCTNLLPRTLMTSIKYSIAITLTLELESVSLRM